MRRRLSAGGSRLSAVGSRLYSVRRQPAADSRKLLAALLLLACETQTRAPRIDSVAINAPPPHAASVPAYLLPLFRDLDTLLSRARQDSLRAMPVEDGYRYRMWHLDSIVKRVEPAWRRTPIGDTILAHHEQGFMTSAIVLDLYHQHLRGQPIDVAGALHRVSPAYVDSLFPMTETVDSVIVERDLDASGRPDRLVHELQQRKTSAQDVAFGHTDDAADAKNGRLALYLDTAATSHAPAWSTFWDDATSMRLERVHSLGEAGSLLVVSLDGADAVSFVVVHARHGVAREVLDYDINYGEGSFTAREDNGRLLVDVAGKVKLGADSVVATRKCPGREWPGSTLEFDAVRGKFVARGESCIPRYYDRKP